MKRLLTIPLLFIYLMAASGVLINLHYCGTQLDSWNIYADGDGCDDGECGDETEENDGCCKDEVLVSKMSQDQQIASLFKFKITLQDVVPPLPYTSLHIAYISNSVSNTLQYNPNAPPGLWQNIPVYILQSNLTYYG